MWSNVHSQKRIDSVSGISELDSLSINKVNTRRNFRNKTGCIKQRSCRIKAMVPIFSFQSARRFGANRWSLIKLRMKPPVFVFCNTLHVQTPLKFHNLAIGKTWPFSGLNVNWFVVGNNQMNYMRAGLSLPSTMHLYMRGCELSNT